ncbi:class I SAM-dependent methyltransferase [Rheinheimera sp.]|uniref:class I SAM-dependent methyltransferase n=1 Tax=Rheinheimera sp. TaxID=1869214 RepID=UPI0027B9A9AB|nr:class I SAM-dependent methyltransferase [Rheinheimera sp.]
MAELSPPASCPLCLGKDNHFYHQDKKRSYFQCQHCQLVFADANSHLAADAEVAIYQQHENNPLDQRYRAFLNKLAAPLLERLGNSGLSGLDFGCGPGPTLSLMLQEAGQKMAVFDPYFANQPEVLTQQYDFICSTEAIEHFYQPVNEWALWLKLLKTNGWLGLMTKLAPVQAEFALWHYKNDPTHVCFFSRDTFLFLANRDGFSLEFIGNDVILLQKI